MAGRKGFAAVLLVALCWLVTGILMAVFIILQVVINPRNHAVPFSIIFGSDKIINHPGDPCSAIEIANFDPAHNITVIFTTISPGSIDFEKSVEQVLVNATLEVGRNSGQLSYYGVPVVARGDEVSLSVRAIDQASAPQSVDISVYDLDGFSQLNANSATNPKFIYNLDRSCLLSATGCVASPTVESEGWFYFVFESEPTPSSLLVSLNSTVRKYDVDVSIIRGGCTLDDETSSFCHIETPKIVSRSSNRGSSSTTYLPFSLTYESNNILPYQNPPVQSLNVSTDLAWTCLRTDLWTYVIVAGVFGCCFASVTIFILFACFSILRSKSLFSKLNRRNHTNLTASTNLNIIRRPNATPEKEKSPEYVRAESLPPNYEDLKGKADDEAPYYS